MLKGKPEDTTEGKSSSDVVQPQTPTAQGDNSGLQPSDE